MTDQSVRWIGEVGQVGEEKQPQGARNKLKKLLQEEHQPAGISELFKREISNCCREEVLVKMADHLRSLRESHRQGTTSQYPIAELIADLRRMAQQKHISTEELFGVLLERLVLGDDLEAARPQVKQHTRERVLNAALELFYEKGFHLATVDEIAERAGVGKGTLYRYFANKGALFNELIKSRLEELEQSAEAVLDGQDDVLTMISKYVRIYFEFFDHNKRLYRLILQERLDLADQAQELYVKKVMRRVPVLKRKIRAASQQGQLKDVDFQTVFFGVMGFIHGVIQKWLVQDCSYPLVDELPTVMDVLFYGFVNNHR
jgi:AcrR family transcriptional regulator